jgi:hypothetical protein
MGSAATRKLEGFAALGGEVPFLFPHDIKIVGLDVDQTDSNWFAYCPRFDEALEPDWIDDIRENGVRQPVDGYRDGNSIVLLEGRRRVRAARIIYDEQAKRGIPEDSRITVRVHVRKGTPQDYFAYNVGSENRKQRSPMQRAALMVQAQKYGSDDKKLAEMFSCTPQTVKNTLALLDLDVSVQKSVDKGELPLREAVKMAAMPREEQKEALAKLREAGATKGAAAANGIRAAIKGEPVKKDTAKMRSRGFLEKWRAVVKKEHATTKVTLNDVLKFILGGGVPSDFPDAVKDSLIEAGFRQKKAAQ